jgi:hypothetical protein
LKSRISATALIGILAGCFIHHDYARWGHRGREAFSAFQMHRFDRYMLPTQPLLATVFTFVFSAAIFIGFYEALVFALSKLLNRPSSPQ